jgi:hypothetical protein
LEQKAHAMALRDASRRHTLRVVATPPAFAASPREGPESPLVGRDAELAYVQHVLERARTERSAHLFTLLGIAGIGKTRLALEVAARANPDVTAFSGRCLGSGGGTTYWPLREIVRQAAGAETAEAVRALLDDADADADRVASRIALALGTSDERSGGDETAWAFRRLFETLALHGPLLVTIEDAHLAAEALLDLIEYVVDRADDAPVVLLCVARPELLSRRPGWGGGMLNAASVRLGPLPPDDAEQLLAMLGGPELRIEVRRQIADAAEGNPLFLEQTLALLASADGDEQRSVPSTIDALLAARLDRLAPHEAIVLEAASTIGDEFPIAALDALLAESIDRTSLHELLTGLTRKELLARASSEGPGSERMRFRHGLIHGAAYGRMPDERAAELHERLGAWAAGAPGRVQDEIVGFHLERAAVLRRRLDPAGERAGELAVRAAGHLAVAGRRAADRGDEAACTSLLERAADLLPQEAPERSRLLLEIAEAYSWSGDYRPAADAHERSEAAARLSGDETAALAASVGRLEAEVSIGRGPTALEAYELAERAAARMDEIGGPAFRSRAWSHVAAAASWLGRHTEAERAARHALTLAENANDDRARAYAVVRLSIALVEGPTPSGPALAEIVTHTAWARALGYRSVEFWLLGYDWELTMLSDDRVRANRLLTERRALVEELGLKAFAPRLDWTEGWSELEIGDRAEGAKKLRSALAAFEAAGEGATAGYVAAMLAEHLAGLDASEADALSLLAKERADANFVEDQIDWRCARACALAARGLVDEAQALAREAVDLADETDSPPLRAHARLVSLTPPLTTNRPAADVAASLTETAEICERKGLLLWAGRARAQLATVETV